MIYFIFQLLRNPHFTSECLFADFFFFLVLSGPRFAKFATLSREGGYQFCSPRLNLSIADEQFIAEVEVRT